MTLDSSRIVVSFHVVFYVLQKARPICFSCGTFFAIEENGYMNVIKLSFMHIAAFPHTSVKEILHKLSPGYRLFLALAQYTRRCKSPLFGVHEYGQPIVNFKLIFQHESVLAYKQEAHDNKIQTILHNSSPKIAKNRQILFQLIQAKLKKSPLCSEPDGEPGGHCTVHSAQPVSRRPRWTQLGRPRSRTGSPSCRPAAADWRTQPVGSRPTGAGLLHRSLQFPTRLVLTGQTTTHLQVTTPTVAGLCPNSDTLPTPYRLFFLYFLVPDLGFLLLIAFTALAGGTDMDTVLTVRFPSVTPDDNCAHTGAIPISRARRIRGLLRDRKRGRALGTCHRTEGSV